MKIHDHLRLDFNVHFDGCRLYVCLNSLPFYVDPFSHLNRIRWQTVVVIMRVENFCLPFMWC